MKVHSSFRKRAVFAGTLVAAFSIVSCQGSQSSPTPSAAEPKSANLQKVFVVFEGPWALVSDPKDPNTILALAPKTKHHRDLYVAASNESTLGAGTYELSVPAHGAAATSALDASFAQTKISAVNLQHAIDDKTGRYVIRVPKPEAYFAERRARSRVGATYPPDASTEQDYVTAVSLLYTVGTLSGFSLAGSPDSGSFNPMLLQVETPSIRFAIEPAQTDDPMDKCNTHSREGFRDAVKYLSLTLYIDFPGDPAGCRKSDPQVARLSKAHVEGMPRGGWYPLAMIDAAKPVIQRLAATYLFHAAVSDCKVPILMLTVSG